MAEFWIEDGQTMVLIGDSITDCGRSDAEAPLGNGYVRMFIELVTAYYPERRIQFLNKGIGGNRVTDLRDRWKDDVLYHKPDRLSIMVGINDLHTYVGDAPGAVSPERFAETYDELLERTLTELGCKVVLITPFYISTDYSTETFRGQVLSLMPQYVETVKALSQKHGTILVDMQAVFQQHLQYRDADCFCPEPVHPHHSGHMVIAAELFRALMGG